MTQDEQQYLDATLAKAREEIQRTIESQKPRPDQPLAELALKHINAIQATF